MGASGTGALGGKEADFSGIVLNNDFPSLAGNEGPKGMGPKATGGNSETVASAPQPRGMCWGQAANAKADPRRPVC